MSKKEVVKEAIAMVGVLDRVSCTGNITRLVELMREFADKLDILQVNNTN